MKNKAFTLVELLIAVSVISLAIFPFLLSISLDLKASIDSKKRFISVNYAKELLEEIKLKNFSESLTISSLGIDEGELSNGRNDNWDDIDDYNLYSEESLGIIDLNNNLVDENYYRIVRVNYVNDLTLEDILVKSKTKKILVEAYSNKIKYASLVYYVSEK